MGDFKSIDLSKLPIPAGDGGSAAAPSFKPPASPKPSPRADFLGGLAGDGFGLSGSVGPGAANRPEDVFAVESVLAGGGLLQRRAGRTFDDATAKGIKAGQRAFNTSHARRLGVAPLKEDGLVNPDGPSQHATRRLARDLVRDDVARAMDIRDQAAKQTDTVRPQSRPQSRPPAPAPGAEGAATVVEEHRRPQTDRRRGRVSSTPRLLEPRAGRPAHPRRAGVRYPRRRRPARAVGAVQPGTGERAGRADLPAVVGSRAS